MRCVIDYCYDDGSIAASTCVANRQEVRHNHYLVRSVSAMLHFVTYLAVGRDNLNGMKE